MEPPPRCSRRSRVAFVDSPPPWGATKPSLQEMVVTPGNGGAGTFTLCAARSLPDLERGISAHLRESRGDKTRQKAETLAMRDKFGLFLSVCSLLVSVQYFIPRGL